MTATNGGGDAMKRYGHEFSEYELKRIQNLLTTTDMSMRAIAQRMKCSTSTVVGINRRFHIREYHGMRTQWTVAGRAE